MRYFAILLDKSPQYHYSGKSVNEKPLKHVRRILHDYEIFFVTDGELNVEQEEDLCVKKGELLIHAKGFPQGGTKPTLCSFYWLHFDAEVQIFPTEQSARTFCEQAFLEQNEKWIFFSEKFQPPTPERLIVRLSELNHYNFEEQETLTRNFLCGALLSEIATQYEKSFSPYAADKRFSEILGWISLHIKEDFSLKELAERFEYNPKYLSVLFQKFTGKTAKRYIVDKKIEMAKRLLALDNTPVKTIARNVGFSDEYYFMRVFKASTGMTPKNYRKTFSGCLYS